MALPQDVAMLPYSTPGQTGSDVSPSRIGSAALQTSHRSLSLSLILLVGGIAACAAGKAGAPLLLWAFASGDVALLGAFVALASDRRRGVVGREPRLAAAVAGGVALVALVLYFVFRVPRGG